MIYPIEGSCLGRCRDYDSNLPCQCDLICPSFEDSCADYIQLCVDPDTGSCLDRCRDFDVGLPCQCEPDCDGFNDCCEDYAQLCVDPDTGSCLDRCRDFDVGLPCQCDPDCDGFNDCFEDYAQLCVDPDTGSCLDRCRDFDVGLPCQCAPDCDGFNDCCEDYAQLCVDPEDGSCSDRCDNYDNALPCQCDSVCADYDDCCLDYGPCCQDFNPLVCGAPVSVGLTCSKLTPKGDNWSVSVAAVVNSSLFTWTQCQMLNVTAYRTNNMMQRLHTSGCNVTRVDSTGSVSIGDVDENSFANLMTFDATSGTVPCGGIQDGTMFVFLMDCYRTEHVRTQFDSLYELRCDNTTALTTQLDTNTNIGPQPVVNISRRLWVDTKLFWVKNTDAVAPNTLLELVEVPGQLEEVTGSTVLSLGTALLLQMCLKINSTDDTRHYFKDGIEIMGLSLKNMYMSNINDHNPVQAGYVSSKQVVFNRCGNQTEPAGTITGQASHYKQPLVPGTQWPLASPNCLVTQLFEVASFITKNVGTSKMNITGELEYCKTAQLTESPGNKNKCFGDVSTTGPGNLLDGYPDCPAAGRTRREVDEDEDDAIREELESSGLPRTFSVDFTIDTGEIENSIQTGPETFVETENCIEMDTFIILTTVLTLLLTIGLLLDAFLVCKILSVKKKKNVKRNVDPGFANKGHF